MKGNKVKHAMLMGMLKEIATLKKQFLKLYKNLKVQLPYAVWAFPSPTMWKLYSYESLHTNVYSPHPISKLSLIILFYLKLFLNE